MATPRYTALSVPPVVRTEIQQASLPLSVAAGRRLTHGELVRAAVRMAVANPEQFAATLAEIDTEQESDT